MGYNRDRRRRRILAKRGELYQKKARPRPRLEDIEHLIQLMKQKDGEANTDDRSQSLDSE